MTVQPLRLLLILLAVLLSGSQAFAQSCSFNVSNMNFGTVNLLGGGAVNSSATLDISCSNVLNVSTNVRICPNLNAGSGGSSGATRRMLGPSASTLDYQLYQNAGRTVPWGSVDQPVFGAPPPIDLLLLPLSTVTAQVTIYGKILASQQAALGGHYSSLFSGTQSRFAYAPFTLVFPPDCSAVTQNPTQVNFTVQTDVDRTCNISAQTVTFGNHTSLGSQIDAAGNLSVTCTVNLPYSISLNGGISNATSPTQRKMTYNSQSVQYGLYRDTARSLPWGSAAGQLVASTGTGALQNIPVYGRVPVQTTPAAGTYNDTVVATITY